MEKDNLVYARQQCCDHQSQMQYKQRDFDILNGFELTYTRCLNCHKIVNLEAKKFSNQ